VTERLAGIDRSAGIDRLSGTARWNEAAEEASRALGGDVITHDAITADFRILQRRRGHRYSLDDLATAHAACEALPGARHYLDLGCGIGSVLLMVGWKLRPARILGIEALPLSAELARRSIALDGLAATILEGDHRDVTRSLTDRFDLVTGTPPYLPPSTAIASPDPQRAAARIELRGGVEDYLASAARVLAEDGRLVICADGRRPDRVERGAAAAELCPLVRRDVWPHPTASHPLFSVWVLARSTSPAPEHQRLLVRGADGEQTPEARALRAFFGLPRGQ
jgi:tRNA1Val (adenine37-N6)-methyltransferase